MCFPTMAGFNARTFTDATAARLRGYLTDERVPSSG